MGTNGRMSDAGVWDRCDLNQQIKAGQVEIPPQCTLPNSSRTAPFVIVGDDAFPLSEHLMKPFPHRCQNSQERIFSYRLSRARRTVENAFGILASRFRVFLSPIALAPEKVTKIVFCAIALHNFLISENRVDFEATAGASTNPSQLTLEGPSTRAYTDEAKNIRKTFSDYFSNEGAVPWQYDV